MDRLIVESILMFVQLWSLHALIGGAPAIISWSRRISGRWRALGIALLIIPFWALLLAQHLWPIGGAASFIVRLALLTAVVFLAEVLLLLPAMRKGPGWARLQVVTGAIASVVPIQLLVPALRD